MEAVEDITTKIGATFNLPDEQKKMQRSMSSVMNQTPRVAMPCQSSEARSKTNQSTV
jgi:hypothetical protein